jgi:predicted DNA-binding protein (MmcQ/YjbR family)
MTVTQASLFAHALGKPGAWQDEPWEGDVVVKVGTKVFAFFGDPDQGTSIGVKCGRTRDEADEWLARYPRHAKPSSYIGRYGWNSLATDGPIPAEELFEALDTSYLEIVSRLPKREQPV